MRKIVFIITDLDNGGAEKMLYKLIKYTDRELYNIHVIYITGKGIMRKEFDKLGIEITSLNLKRRIPTIKAIKKSIKICKDADIIQAWMYHADLWGYVIGKVFLNKKVVFGIRDSNLNKKYNKKVTLLINKINAYLSKKVDKVISCSYEGKMAHVESGYSEKNIIVIPNGFELDRCDKSKCIDKDFKKKLGVSDEEKVVVSVGRWHKIKDYPNLFRAVKILADKNLKFKCLLVGTGLEESNEELVNLIEKENIKNKVILMGKSNEVPVMLSNSDLYILHSAGEGFSNSLGEAMACSVPCVATDVGDCSYILKGLGTIVESRNPQALAEAIDKKLRMSSDERKREGSLLRKRVEESYDIKVVVNKYYEVYNDLLVKK